MNRLFLALSFGFLTWAMPAQADRILSRHNARVYIEAEDRFSQNRSIDIYHRGKRIGRFKVIKYLAQREVLVVKDARRKLKPKMNVSLRSPKSLRRKPSSKRKYHVFERSRKFRRSQEMDFGVYAGTGAVGPVGADYIDDVNPGYTLGAFTLYKMNRKWDLQVALQVSSTEGSGEKSDSMSIEESGFIPLSFNANYDYKVTGSLKTLKIPVTANYNYNKNWVVRLGGYVDFILSAEYEATVKVTSVENSLLGTIDAFDFTETTFTQDATEFLNTTSYGLTTGVSYVYKQWRFNLDAGYSFNEAFKSGMVIDNLDVGNLDLFGLASVPISQSGIELEKPTSHSAFGQLTISYMF